MTCTSDHRREDPTYHAQPRPSMATPVAVARVARAGPSACVSAPGRGEGRAGRVGTRRVRCSQVAGGRERAFES